MPFALLSQSWQGKRKITTTDGGTYGVYTWAKRHKGLSRIILSIITFELLFLGLFCLVRSMVCERTGCRVVGEPGVDVYFIVWCLSMELLYWISIKISMRNGWVFVCVGVRILINTSRIWKTLLTMTSATEVKPCQQRMINGCVFCVRVFKRWSINPSSDGTERCSYWNESSIR